MARDAAYYREYRLKNLEKRRAYERAYREANRDKEREKSRRYQATEKGKERTRQFAAANPEKCREADRRSYQKHREERLAKDKEWNESEAGRKYWAEYYQRPEVRERLRARGRVYRDQNREQEREKSRRYEARNREERNARHLAWSKTEKGRLHNRLAAARRRAREMNAGGVASYEQVMARVAFYGERCYLCHAEWEHIDHVIPLSRGGSNWPANLRPICAACNGSKHARLLEEVKRSRLSVVSA